MPMETEILILGGSLSAIATALELKAQGREVVLATHRSYLGEDLCDPLRLALPADLDLRDPLMAELFAQPMQEGRLFRPMWLKQRLDAVMEAADIPVLLGFAPGEIFTDKAGQLAGVSLCSRGGRRWISCAQVVDGTVRLEAVRLAGLPVIEPQGTVRWRRRILSEVPVAGWEVEGVFPDSGLQLLAMEGQGALGGGDWGSWMALEITAREAAYVPGQSMSADGIELLDPVQPGTAEALGGRLHAMGGFVRPDAAVAAGRSLGGSLAVLPVVAAVRSCSQAALPVGVDAMELGADPELPPGGFAAVTEVDVLVVGGGTGGAPAGIAAARGGARTLVTEFLSGLGGVGTLGMIGRYWYGNRVGFTAEVDAGSAALTTRQMKPGNWDVEAKMQWLQGQIHAAGGQVWYKTMAAGALRRGADRVCGAVVCTPQGRVAVLAKVVIDATGSADVAAAAGAETVAIGEGHLALQGTGLPGRAPGQNYTNTDYDFVDDTQPEDVASAHVTARKKFQHAFDAGQLVDTRERRRVVGDVEVSPMDIRLKRVFPDSLVKARSNFDTHGFTVHPLFMIVPPGHDPLEAFVPLRALLPRGLEGILVTGLGISAHRDAMPVIRMQADVQNQGYAAGTLAAMAGESALRGLDIADVQARLVAEGILEAEIAGAADSFPLAESEIAAALRNAPQDPDQIDRVFTLPDAERNARLQAAWRTAADSESRRFYAFVLGILGLSDGVEDLAAQVRELPWDAGWNYTGMGQFGESMSALDARIIALGRCGRPEDALLLAEKASGLPADAAFSHYRVLAEAWMALGNPAAVPALESLLAREEIQGHALQSGSARAAKTSEDPNETGPRNQALIELHLATALWRLSPGHPVARAILGAYARDVRGLFARFAAGVLKA